MSDQFSYPPARLTTIVSSDPNHLPFAQPAEPTNTASGPGSNATEVAIPDQHVLHALASALLNADISHVRPRVAGPALAPAPGTVEHALMTINHQVFAHSARPAPTPAPPPTAAEQQQQQQPLLQEPDKPARVLPATRTAAGTLQQAAPAAKRRKRAVSTDEEFVARTVDPQQVAADVAAQVAEFMASALSLHAEAVGSGEDESADNVVAAGAGDSTQRKPFVTHGMLKSLHGSLAAGKQAGIIVQLDHQQLRQLLLLLLDHIRLGTSQLIDEHDKASDASSKAVLAALESACCCMQLLAAPGLPNSLYLDEVITATIELAKYQLQYNVLALHDPQYKRLYRPSSAHGAAGQPSTSKKRARNETAGGKVPRVLADVLGKLELLLSLLARVVDCVLLEVERLLPLVRIGLTCLNVDSLQLLQTQAITLAVAVFRAYPQQRSSLMDEVLGTVVANINCLGSKGPPRLYQATDAAVRPLRIQMSTALVMQLVQVSVQLPPIDADPAVIQRAFSGAYGWPDKFWEGVFARLPAAKAAKSEGAADFKAVLEALLADLLTVQMLPEWPAATILLRRFLKVLYSDKGLKHPDAHVKLAAVEFTGQLVSRLCAEALQAEQEADEVQAVIEASQGAADPALLPEGPLRTQQVLDSLLLDYLASIAGSSDDPTSCAAAARRFVCCRMLNDAILLSSKLAGKKGPKKEDLSLLLVQHRQQQDSKQSVLGAGLSDIQLTRALHVGLVRRWVVEGPLGAGRGNIIKWLVDAGSRSGPDPNPATVRTKVFKCLGNVVEADSRVLALPEVASSVRAALDDDSVAVREATLELLAKLIATNPQLAGDYFDVLVQASHDPGVSVRKRAIKSLWDCCTCAGFSRAAEAVVAVLQRAGDTEGSMRGLVTKICGEMWFTEGSSFAGLSDTDPTTTTSSSSSSSVRSAQVRARELAEVSLKVYEAWGKGIHVPLPPDHALVSILKEVLGQGSSASSSTSTVHAKELAHVRSGAAEVAEALLAMILQSQQEQAEDDDDGSPVKADNGQHGQFPYLLALHELCAADPSLAAPAKDPQRFLRCLAPYVTPSAQAAGLPGTLSRQLSRTASVGGGLADEVSRRSAEECLCLLAVIEALLRHLGVLEKEVLQQLSADLVAMFQTQRIPQVISAGCRLLCAIAPLHPVVIPHLSQLATKCYNVALNCLSQQQAVGASTPNSPAHTAQAPRALYILGQLCRYGANLLDETAQENAGMKSCSECLELCIVLWQRREVSETAAGQRVRDAALQALGMMVIGKPQMMLQQLQTNLLGAADQQRIASGGGAAATSTANSAGSEHGSPPQEQQQQQQKQQQDQGASVAPGLSQLSVARVYASALSGQESVLVKTRVLTNLVELLRSEEAALVARQKDSEAAAASSRLASTLPSESKGPLSKVNGEADAAGSSSSSIIQTVWQDVLKLATGVPGVGGSVGGSAGGSTLVMPGSSAAGSIEAAVAMRRKALELIEVVLRGGLVAPWSAVPPLVAQSTDTAPDTRQAALKVLKGATDKYADYVAGQLAPGVVEAYRFQSRMWAAKHPGQPLPKAPSSEVLDGLAAMYADVVQQPMTNTSTRQRFLSNLFKPFDAACNLANPAAVAREDIYKLAFCAYVAAALPFKRADEPLVLIHVINTHVSRQAQEVRDCLKRQLLMLGLRQKLGLEEDDEDMEEQEQADAAAAAASQQQQASGANPQQHPQQQSQDGSSTQQQSGGGQLVLPLSQEVLAPLKASLALCMLLVLKQYLMAAYGLTDERVAAFELKGERYKAEAKALVSRDRRLGEFGLGPINLRATADATGDLLAEQYKTFRGLLDNDAANYREAAVLAALEGDDDDDAAAAAAGGQDAAAHHPSATPAAGVGAPRAPGLVVFSMDNKKLARTKSGRGGARTTGGKAAAGRAGGQARGKGSRAAAASTGRARKGKKRKSRHGSDDDDDDDDDDDEEWEGDGKRRLW